MKKNPLVERFIIPEKNDLIPVLACVLFRPHLARRKKRRVARMYEVELYTHQQLAKFGRLPVIPRSLYRLHTDGLITLSELGHRVMVRFSLN